MACAIKTQIARINQDASALAGCEAFVSDSPSSHNRILQGVSQFDQKSPYSSLSYEGSNYSPQDLGPSQDGNQQKPHIQPLGNKQDNGLWGSFKNGLGWLWDKTKEYSGKAWDFIKEKASDLWDWVKANPGKAIAGAVVLILLFGSGIGEAGTAVAGLGAGATTATEMGIGGVLGYLFVGDLTGGFTGALTAPLFRMSARYIASSRLGMWIVRQFGPTVGKWFSNSFGGAFSSFTDTAMYQSLKGKFNLKNLVVYTLLGAATPLVFYFATPFLKMGVDLIQKIPIGPSLATAGGPAERATIGDTSLGQWLQKFAGSGDSVAGTVPKIDPRTGMVREVTKTYKRGPKKGQTVVIKREVMNWKGEWIPIYGDKGLKGYEEVIRKNGQKIIVPYNKGFPDFSQWTAVELELPKDMWFKSDDEQFKYLGPKAYEIIVKDPNLKSQFTEADLQLLKIGKRPKQFVWHHHEKPGKMQLVPRDIHESCVPHTGGRAIWGGGSDYR